MSQSTTQKFSTAPVFFTAISTILGAILFLRFGFAVGTLGFFGVILIILLGHLVTIPTAFSISEIATNQRVKGGGEYFIISRSFGLNIGATIGIALYLSQAISVAFYVIAFTEAFSPVFNWMQTEHGIYLPRQVISLPAMTILAFLILRKGANLGVKVLYIIVTILTVSLVMFFMGSTPFSETARAGLQENPIRNFDQFYLVLAIIFPAFTGMTAGVGLSGDLKNPGKSIPLGTVTATLAGFVIYIFIAWKLINSATPADLMNDQLIMGKIAIGGQWIIPIGLAASTISSAIGSVMVAPRTLQALGLDRVFPAVKINRALAKGQAKTNEPFNATLVTIIIAFVFVALGDVDIVARIITMFFMVTYGSLCLISFLNHFGASPAYRPTFRSRWYVSLIGFVMAIFLMFRINSLYAVIAIAAMTLIYLLNTHYHKNRRGLEAIFSSALFQLNRNLQVYLQKTRRRRRKETWHPSVVLITDSSWERQNAFNLLSWLSYRYGFGTYIHLIKGYLSKSTHEESKKVLQELIEKSEDLDSQVYVDTLISPSYTSAIAQIIQLPGISGMENNLLMFEHNKRESGNLTQIAENFSLAHAANYDVCILGSSDKYTNFRDGIHVWIQKMDFKNINLMILLSYIILGHPAWRKGSIKIYYVAEKEKIEESRDKLYELIESGRLPISKRNIEMIEMEAERSIQSMITEKSSRAGLTMIGFLSEQIKHEGPKMFQGYDKIGDVLFVNAVVEKEIK